ncbi:MAG: carboxylate--amine ligase [Actinobacteria bacterium]|nr:carboxylate--amine ligase [Actinomycetota bacterium]
MPTLSEADSKARVAAHGVLVPDERIVATADDAVAAAEAIGFPVVTKLCGDAIAHKTERGLVRLNLRTADDVRAAAVDLLAAATPEDGPVALLVAPMLSGNRELIAGLHTDAQFGPTVMLGVGGILAEAIRDVVFRLVPITALDAAEMIDDLGTQPLLGAFRGEPAIDRGALAATLLGLSALSVADPSVVSVDLNPLIVVDGRPIAVDALVELAEGSTR